VKNSPVQGVRDVVTTFATLSLRAGMSPLPLQGLVGHATLVMTRRYTQMVDDDD